MINTQWSEPEGGAIAPVAARAYMTTVGDGVYQFDSVGPSTGVWIATATPGVFALDSAGTPAARMTIINGVALLYY